MTRKFGGLKGKCIFANEKRIFKVEDKSTFKQNNTILAK